MASVLDHLAAVHWPALAAAMLLQLARHLVRSRAWHNLLRAAFPGTRLRWPAVAGAVLASAGANTVAPARLGDVLRLAVVRRELGARCCLPTLGATLVAEAALDAVVAGALVAAVLASGRLVAPAAVADGFGAALHGAVGRPWLAVAAVAGAVAAGLAVRLAARGRLGALRSLLDGVRGGLAGVREPARYAREVASWQLLSWLLRVATVLCALHAFGIEATPTTALLVVAAQILSGVVPVAGGAGVQQALVVVALRGHASAGEAVAFGVGLQAAVAVANLSALGAVAAVAVPRLGAGGLRALVARRAVPEPDAA